jgi:UDP-N-acetylglucosamine 2-epimerase
MQNAIYITAPHRHIFIEALDIFGLQPDGETAPAQQESSGSALQGIDRVIGKYKPDYVLVLGDTSAAIESSLLHFPANRGEASLHMYELSYRAPEETNCAAIKLAATYYFVPAEVSRDSLIQEGGASEKLSLIDSIAVDALLMTVERIRNDEGLKAKLASAFPFLDPARRLVFVTGQGHENQEALNGLCSTLKRMAVCLDVQVVCTTPPGGFMEKVFAGHPNIKLIPPPDYLHLVYLMQAASLILTDMGDTLKEALSLSKPVLVTGEATGRHETIGAATIRMAGTDAESIVHEGALFLDALAYYQSCSRLRNPLGDGVAGQHIAETLPR